VGGEEDEIKIRGDCENGGKKRKESMGEIWKDQDRRTMMEMGRGEGKAQG